MLAGEEFNINSPKQLGEVLFEKMGLPVIKKTKKGYSTNAAVSVDYFSDQLAGQKISLGVITATFDANGFLDNVPKIPALGQEYRISHQYNQVTVTADNGYELRFTIDQKKYADTGTNAVELDLTEIGSMTLQIGANENQTLELRMPPITKKNLGLAHTDVLTEESAGKAIGEISNAISFVSSIRSSLGAYQNRLEHTTTNLDITSENMTSAYSRIMDVDMATEMTKYSSLQVISQAATSMLAQANERPSQVLQLLQ